MTTATTSSFLPSSPPHLSLTNPKKTQPSIINYTNIINNNNYPRSFTNSKLVFSPPVTSIIPKAVTHDQDKEAVPAHQDQDDDAAKQIEDGTNIISASLSTTTTLDRALNAAIVLGAGTFAITKLLTIDHDYWQGWTLYEVLRYAPEHNWTAYEEALKSNPVLAKMVISGIVYSLGDWIAQCCQGKPLLEFDRTRMLRSGLVGFTLHGSLSHYYYQFCEALFPFNNWWVVPAKVAFDQTFWSAVWNSIYFVALGFLRLESPSTIFYEFKATFFPMLTV